MSHKVTIQIVTWNSLLVMPHCLHSIFEQTYKDFQVLVIDNNSQDNTVDFIRKNYPEVAVLHNNKNHGFARANNQGLMLLKSPYVVLCNPDIVLEPDWLEKTMAVAEDEKYKVYGGFGGKLLKLKLLVGDGGEVEKTTTIDSCGLKILKNHRVVEIGSGEPSENFVNQQEIFGHSGALALYKREALENCIIKNSDHNVGDYFDGDFFFYKEDVDLAWRLQLLGWKSLFLPEVTAFHLRTMSGSDKIQAWQIIANRRQQSRLAKYYSYRNHFLVLLGNEFWSNLLFLSPYIFWYELKKFIFILLFETSNLKAIGEVLRLLPRTLRKRKLIMGRAKVDATYFRDYWLK